MKEKKRIEGGGRRREVGEISQSSITGKIVFYILFIWEYKLVPSVFLCSKMHYFKTK